MGAQTPREECAVHPELPIGERTRRALAVLFVLLTLFHAVKAYRTVARGHTSDVRTWYHAAASLARGESPYQEREITDDYIYPPLFCTIYIPLTWLPEPAAAAAWALVNGGLWLLAARLSLEVFPLAGWWAVLPSVLAIRPLLNNWGHGQVNLLVLVTVVAALLALARGRPWSGGAWLGVGCALKVIPGLFVTLHALRMEWRPVLAALLAFGLCVMTPALVAGPSAAVVYLRDWSDFLARHATSVEMYTHSMNQSLFACVMRFLTPTSVSKYAELAGERVNVAALDPSEAARVFLALLVAIGLLMAWRLRHRSDLRLEYAFLFVTLPFFSKTAMTHHWAMLLYVYTALVSEAAAHRWLWWPTGIAFALTTLGSRALWGAGESSLVQAFSPHTLALFVLFGALWVHLGRLRAAECQGASS